jgi:ubiquinone biosynthesis protein Coq4
VQAFRFFRAYFGLVRDPRNLDYVFQLIDAAPEGRRTELLLSNPKTRRVTEQPLMPSLPDVTTLLAMPEGTVGRAYGELIERDGLDPEPLDYQQGDAPLHRFRRHMRASHDLWHVVTGFGTDVRGEIALQAFYMAQWGNPLSTSLLSAALLHATLKRGGKADDWVEAIHDGWALGRQADDLMGYDWHAALGRPLSEVRAELRVPHETQLAA